MENKSLSIRQIFDNMDYGENFEKLNEGLEWLRSKNSFSVCKESSDNSEIVEIKSQIDNQTLCTEYIPETDAIKDVLSNANGKIKWIDTDAYQRAKTLYKLAEEIEKNASLLCQIEIVCRGILSKDTKSKAVPLLAQYFYYYSGFAVKFSHENPNWKPKGIAVGIIPNENILSNVGLMLAPALASGYNIVLQLGTTIFPAVAFLTELAKKVGIPEEVITLIPSDSGDLVPYLSNENVAILTLFTDLNNEKYDGVNNFNKKILNLASNKTPVIIFDNADLDSASSSITDSAYSYKGLLPWSVDTVLVQENVFNVFLNKLKTKLKSTKVGLANNKLVDISTINETSLNKLKTLIKLAKIQGIEVFQPDDNSNLFTPTLFIGNRVMTNRVVSAEEDQDANTITVLAFRTIDEAVNLANNSRQGLAASVWTENLGIVNEVTKKLRVNNVWINSHGLTSAEIPISPIKDSGVGYFGGKEGFYEYVQVAKHSEQPSSLNKIQKIDNSCASFISFTKKSQENWRRLSRLNKAKIFQKFADYIVSNKKDLSCSVTEAFLDEWIAEIYQYTTESNKSCSTIHLDFNVVSTHEPLGVVAIENEIEYELKNIRLILAALLAGNAVILITSSTDSLPFYNELSTRLPPAVFTVLCYNFNNIQVISAHKELNAYFGEGVNPLYSHLPIRESKLFKTASSDWNDVYRKVTFVKNVWSNIGKSSTCNLSTY
ncbi:hypothetical protein NQ315_005382 [Exocentrus adspersus]|uniref:Aldehyde dehydrogenase domain-containing protein n=1 Tax=Exocentrus adspersus TaxID=1586481 RepID=A0AAV8W1L4_9CUCU|nr:hypothetical protein NQ315_005382 [Exocentrus adspersus]